jgi:hypothetical protein
VRGGSRRERASPEADLGGSTGARAAASRHGSSAARLGCASGAHGRRHRREEVSSAGRSWSAGAGQRGPRRCEQ